MYYIVIQRSQLTEGHTLPWFTLDYHPSGMQWCLSTWHCRDLSLGVVDSSIFPIAQNLPQISHPEISIFTSLLSLAFAREYRKAQIAY